MFSKRLQMWKSTAWPWLSLWKDVSDEIQGHLILSNRPRGYLCSTCHPGQDLEPRSEGPGREGACSRGRRLPQSNQHPPRLKGQSLGLQSPSQGSKHNGCTGGFTVELV